MTSLPNTSFLITQLVVNSKKIVGSAAGKQNGLKKTEACFFGYSFNHNTWFTKDRNEDMSEHGGF